LPQCSYIELEELFVLVNVHRRVKAIVSVGVFCPVLLHKNQNKLSCNFYYLVLQAVRECIHSNPYVLVNIFGPLASALALLASCCDQQFRRPYRSSFLFERIGNLPFPHKISWQLLNIRATEGSSPIKHPSLVKGSSLSDSAPLSSAPLLSCRQNGNAVVSSIARVVSTSPRGIHFILLRFGNNPLLQPDRQK